MITIDMYQSIINEQVPKMNQQIKKLKSKEQKDRKIREIKRNIYIGLNNVTGTQSQLYQFILIWEDIDLNQIREQMVRFAYIDLQRYMVANYLLDIEYKEDLKKLVISDHYKVYVNLSTKQCSVTKENLFKGFSDQRNKFICQLDYRDIDQQFTWEDFVK